MDRMVLLLASSCDEEAAVREQVAADKNSGGRVVAESETIQRKTVAEETVQVEIHPHPSTQQAHFAILLFSIVEVLNFFLCCCNLSFIMICAVV